MPGQCKGKAHRAEHLGYAGRRVLVSRKWSGKTLADHRADRKAWLTAMLDLPATNNTRYEWERVSPSDRYAMTPTRKLLHVLDERATWRKASFAGATSRRSGRGPWPTPGYLMAFMFTTCVTQETRSQF
jgi:hypothetical protein